MKIVLATSNRGKILEFNALFKGLSVELIPQAEFHVKDVPETGLTFIENALLKARHAAKMTGLPAIADDSGLVVDALHGAPGIYSARYAGANADNAAHIHRLLTELLVVPDEKRHAHFHCTLVFMAHDSDPAPLVCDGRWQGMILREPRGEHGFGYDPVFYLPALQKTAAELSLAQKNNISHRGIALQSLLKLLSDQL